MQTIVNIWNVWPIEFKDWSIIWTSKSFFVCTGKEMVLFFLSFLLGFCFVFLLVWSDCLKKIRASKENWFIHLICKLVDNLSTSCRYAISGCLLKPRLLMFLVNLQPPPSPPTPTLKKSVLFGKYQSNSCYM